MTRAGKTILTVIASVALSCGDELAVGFPQDQAPAAAGQSEAAPHRDLPQRVRVSNNVMQGLIVTKVPPQYPEKARKKRIQGTVVMHAVISKAGDIKTVELVSGHPLLAPPAIEAVKQWKYRPYLLNGNPVEVDTEIVVNFTLAGN
jgi:TonB family protein